MPRTPREVARALLPTAASAAVREARGILGRQPKIDPSGWTTGELAAYLDAGRSRLVPPRRAGHVAVRLTNSLDGTLPVEAVVLARAVADAAPPVGQEIGSALQQILERYLPDTLLAFRNSGSVAATPQGHRLIVEQLRLLHQVTRDVTRAQAEHDDRELRVQEAFLHARFDRPRNGLDLPPVSDPPAVGAPPGAGMPSGLAHHSPDLARGPGGSAGTPNAPTAPRPGTAAAGAHHRLTEDSWPTAVLPPADPKLGITGRLALPTGLAVTMGAVFERHTGAIGFVTATSKRWQARRRQRGFGSAQVDVQVVLPPRVRRFAVIASARPTGPAAEIVLFLSTRPQSTAECPSTLVRRSGATTTVIASGHLTGEGLVVRNESIIYPTLRAACDGFDYRRVTWLSDDTPAV